MEAFIISYKGSGLRWDDALVGDTMGSASSVRRYLTSPNEVQLHEAGFQRQTHLITVTEMGDYLAVRQLIRNSLSISGVQNHCSHC